MAGAAQPTQQETPKKSRLPLILGLVMAVGGGGGGFATVQLGLLDSLFPPPQPATTAEGTESSDAHAQTAHAPAGQGAQTAFGFLPLTPITINVGNGDTAQMLRFGAQLEVPLDRSAEVQHLMPRIIDVLNIYLRALDPRELQDPAAILRLRGQMLRRAQIVAGPGAVHDLLIEEFVMN